MWRFERSDGIRMSIIGKLTLPTKISVLVPDDEAVRFESYCNDRGHKKSTLIVRLIKEHLDKEHYPFQRSLIEEELTESSTKKDQRQRLTRAKI